MVYALQVIVYTAAMLLIYTLFLRNKVHHRLSRYYLLLSAVLPLLIPFMQLPDMARQQLQNATTNGNILPGIVINSISGAAAMAPVSGLSDFSILYFIIAVFVLAINLSGLIKLLAGLNNGNFIKDGAVTIVPNSGYGPGSFGNYIFFPGGDIDPTILAHEQAHIMLRHSYDIVLLTLLQAVCWPNIFLYRIKQELKEVHEFQADRLVNADTDAYAQLILSTTFNTHSIALMHSFVNHPIKRRIMMLRKNGAGSPLKAAMLVLAAMAVLFSAALVVQSCSKKEEAHNATSQPAAVVATTNNAIVKETAKESAHKADDPKTKATVNHFEKTDRAVKKVADENSNRKPPVSGMIVAKSADVRPQFIGADGDLNAFVSKELHYPESAKINKIQGKVIVKFTVSKTGKVISPEVLRSPDPELTKAALDVVAKMPDWKPGYMNNGEKVDEVFYLPIDFRL